MSLRIQTNVEAFNAQRHLSATTDKLATAMERLSSGYRINRAADDAAGLSISEKLEAQIKGLDQANRNAQDAVSLVQTSEGSLDEVHEMLQRVRELAVQYKNGTLSEAEFGALKDKMPTLRARPDGVSAKFKELDKDHNGALTLEEFRSMMSQGSRRPGATPAPGTPAPSTTPSTPPPIPTATAT